MMNEKIREAIGQCIREAIGRPDDEWYAVALWPDGKCTIRCGIGSITYSEAEYHGYDGAEETIYVTKGIPDIDPLGEWIDPDTGETDIDGATSQIIEDELEQYEEEEVSLTHEQLVEYVETYIEAVEARHTTHDLIVFARIDGDEITFGWQPQQYELADNEIELALISDPLELFECEGMAHQELVEHLIANNDLRFFLAEKLAEATQYEEEVSHE